MEKVSNTIQAKFGPRVRMKISPANATMGTKRPDIVCYAVSAVIETDYYIEIVGELKDSKLPDKELLDCEFDALLVFAAQPTRPFVFTFLANHDSIIFVRFERPRSLQDRPSFVRTPCLPLIGSGGAILLSLLHGDENALGTVISLRSFDLPILGTVLPTGYLGHGRCVYAYSAVLAIDRFRTVVVKQYNSDDPVAAAAYKAELLYLRKLAPVLAGKENLHQIPSVLGELNPYVVLEPVAQPLSELSESADEFGIFPIGKQYSPSI
jgi:hypothetical protein